MRMSIEVIWPHILAKHHIIVQIKEFVRQSWDPVKMRFYGWRGKGREVALVWEQVLKKKKKKKKINNNNNKIKGKHCNNS